MISRRIAQKSSQQTRASLDDNLVQQKLIF